MTKPATRSAVPAWVGLGRELQRTERERLWAGRAPTFTQWVKQRAVELDVSEGTLWRALSAVQRYELLFETTATRGLRLPELAHLPCGIAAQSVELLEKIARVAPTSVVDDLAQRLVRGDAPRELLRLVWQKFEPLLDGATERGRGTAQARKRLSREAVAATSLEAGVVKALVAARAAWLGVRKPAGYAVFTDVVPDSASPGDVEFDAVVAVRRWPGERAELHGLEITGPGTDSATLRRKLNARAGFVDFVWVATSDRWAARLVNELPEHIGIVTAANSGLNVTRPALLQPASRAEALLRALILPTPRR